MEATRKEEIKNVINRLARLSYWFSKEMLKEMDEAEAFEKACKEAQKKAEQNPEAPIEIMISAASGYARTMRHCLEATNSCIDYLRKDDNAEYVESWQLAGINAMFDKANEEHIIPFDIPYAIQGILGMWDEIKKSLDR